MISEDLIQRIKEENDIVDVISETVKLRRAGRNHVGLCPFHHEKSPSFSVSQDKQIFKCFGCGEAGNVISFVMKTKKLTFLEAVHSLADRVHIELEPEDGKQKNQRELQEKWIRLNVEAARFYFSNLRKYEDIKAYFLRRGISETTIRRFGLGYSLDSWNSLLKYLKAKGYTELDLLSAGLIIKSEKGTYYDRFRNRVMFPVFDVRGKVIGFGGRVMDDSKPKYLNSPETMLFKKGTNLYGLNFAIQGNMNRTLIIVEGYMDCIALHQYGITNVAASLGTALTTNQAKLMKRYADEIIVAYDADLAGQTATVRGLEILRNEGFRLKVLKVPQGKDPDEFIRSNGRDAFQKLIDNALPFIEYRIQKAKENLNLNQKEMLIEYAKRVADIVMDLDPVEKDVYIKKVSEETGIKEQAIYDLIGGELQKNVSEVQNVNIEHTFGQKLYLEPAHVKAVRSLLKLMLENQETFDYIRAQIKEQDLISESHRKLFALIIQYIDFENKEGLKKIEIHCDDEESSKEWINIMDMEIICEENDFSKLIDDYIREVRKYRLEESKKEIMNKIKQYESEGLVEQSLGLAQRLVEIQKEIAKL